MAINLPEAGEGCAAGGVITVQVNHGNGEDSGCGCAAYLCNGNMNIVLYKLIVSFRVGEPEIHFIS